MNYKIGDKVLIADLETCVKHLAFNKKRMSKWCGKVMTIRDTSGDDYYMEEDIEEFSGNTLKGWAWCDAMIERKIEEEIGMFKKDMLRSGDVLVYRSGMKELIMLNCTDQGVDVRVPIRNDNTRGSGFNYVSDINFETMATPSGVIVKVMRPDMPGGVLMKITAGSYSTVWERKETQKLTVAEISKRLGYDVEVVRG